MDSNETTIYEQVGGDATFKALVDAFYDRIEQDEMLKAMFPDDLEPGKQWQYLFLSQYFGGPARYIEQRGHPRLRMRHMPFLIDEASKDRWLQYMLAAIDEVGIEEPARSVMREYFERGAAFMVNTVKPGGGNQS
jgi:hemoglobin